VSDASTPHTGTRLVKLDKQAKLFIGFMPEGKLRLAFESANLDQYVSEGGGGKFLTQLELDGKKYLGKVVDGGLATDRVDDVARNVMSILRRLFASERLPATLSIFALVE